MATIAHAAWALTISQYTANPDTPFGATLPAREAAAARIQNPESIAGPTIPTVPYRTVIHSSGSVAGFLAGMQRDAVSTVWFGQLGLETIQRQDESCRRACCFDSIFQVMQEADHGRGVIVRPPSDTNMGEMMRFASTQVFEAEHTTGALSASSRKIGSGDQKESAHDTSASATYPGLSSRQRYLVAPGYLSPLASVMTAHALFARKPHKPS
ncbi:HC-toxin synthetase [Metarhizium acridum CQMa 102]|uniref:HC-toxin synthetase n=1 Tax=Metarhizium acridum (strain CQMa 102) TaxID=655827 RepID=E9E6G5_METAQ|nr:HC-toxin synthetase [Metarhizium acridum CQMa 102]EFY88411.1 HC-toxin synthetase [Metarhizium acridum CQMa 102]